MKAVVVHAAGDLRVDELPVPDPGAGQVRVRIVYGGICGSDLHYAHSGRNGVYEVVEPLTLGHEVVGVVDRAGPGVDVAAGMPVAIHPATPTPAVGAARGSGLNLAVGGTYLGSASTSPHTQGGFAEHLIVMEGQLRPLPAGLPLRRAVLAEPLAVAIHAVGLLGDRVQGARVLVSGAGPIGALAISALRAAGASHITAADLHRAPLRTALGVGADAVVQLGVDPALTDDSFDIVVEAAGAVPSLVTALRVVRRGGAILQLGILPPGDLSIPLASMVAKEVHLQGTQRFDSEIDEAIDVLAADEQIENVISHEFDIADAAEAFEHASDATRSAKVILGISPDPTA
ncbi:L-idonate 5-dehydrogenase [Microbacterium sp. YJN-G]|uniref:L-idonate 5-dehydrogenase n=1 Tax=Microbacterium sp. YJN-G TaxID=2763257 RepID=UPI001877E394|nr:L-idonate 5-dehydrogenase [Microbacterium sp. YJN-G]